MFFVFDHIFICMFLYKRTIIIYVVFIIYIYIHYCLLEMLERNSHMYMYIHITYICVYIYIYVYIYMLCVGCHLAVSARRNKPRNKTAAMQQLL